MHEPTPLHFHFTLRPRRYIQDGRRERNGAIKHVRYERRFRKISEIRAAAGETFVPLGFPGFPGPESDSDLCEEANIIAQPMRVRMSL